MLVSKEIDIKLYYRFVEFVSKLIGYNLPHERFKRIILDDYKAESKEEKQVKNFANAYLYILNNINQSFTKEIIQESYYLLTHQPLEEQISKQILESYYMYYDESSHYVAMMVHFKVLELINNKKTEFAFMISNLIMLKKGRYPLVPYEYIFEIYHKTIKQKNKDKIMVIFSEIEATNKPYENESDLSKDEIIIKIKNVKKHLINDIHVKKLYLYGSYAKEKTTKYSDLDFLVIFDSKILPLEKGILQKKLKDYLENIIKIHIDILDFTNALENLDINEMENIITLI